MNVNQTAIISYLKAKLDEANRYFSADPTASNAERVTSAMAAYNYAARLLPGDFDKFGATPLDDLVITLTKSASTDQTKAQIDKAIASAIDRLKLGPAPIAQPDESGARTGRLPPMARPGRTVGLNNPDSIVAADETARQAKTEPTEFAKRAGQHGIFPAEPTTGYGAREADRVAGDYSPGDTEYNPDPDRLREDRDERRELEKEDRNVLQEGPGTFYARPPV